MEGQFANAVRVHLEGDAVAGCITVRLVDDFIFEEQLVALNKEGEAGITLEMFRQIVVKLLKKPLCDRIRRAVGPGRLRRFVEELQKLLDGDDLGIGPLAYERLQRRPGLGGLSSIHRYQSYPEVPSSSRK